MNLSSRRPSPAMIVAAVALSFAFVGSAVAGTEAVVSKLDKKETKQVQKLAKKQANKQIKKRAPGLSVANAQNASALGGVDAAAFQQKPRWVQVKFDGTIEAQSGGITAGHPTDGNYVLDFNEDISGKFISATARGAPTFVSTAPDDDPTHLLVQTSDNTGAPADRPFYLGVFP